MSRLKKKKQREIEIYRMTHFQIQNKFKFHRARPMMLHNTGPSYMHTASYFYLQSNALSLYSLPSTAIMMVLVSVEGILGYTIRPAYFLSVNNEVLLV